MSIGVIFEDRRLLNMTEAERFEYLKQVSRSGGQVPADRVTGSGEAVTAPPAAAAPTATPAAPERPPGVFDPAALYTGLEDRSERYTMPGGDVVWVHAPSVADARWVNDQGFLAIRRAGLLSNNPRLDEEKQKELGQRALISGQFFGQVYQVIAVCRQGPKISDPKVFEAEHAEALLNNPGWSEAVQEIAGISDRLAVGRSEAAAYREVAASFFGVMASWLETWCSRLTTDSLPCFTEILTDFASSARVMTQPGALSAEGFWALSNCLIPPDAALGPDDAETEGTETDEAMPAV